MELSEDDGTRTRNLRIDSVEHRLFATLYYSTICELNSLLGQVLLSAGMLHRIATVLYGIVQYGGTYEAPDPQTDHGRELA